MLCSGGTYCWCEKCKESWVELKLRYVYGFDRSMHWAKDSEARKFQQE
jgi:hypothetical protein